MKQLAITALLSSLILGCASTGKQSSHTPQEYFAENNKTGKSSEQIKKELWRQGTNSMIGDAVTVFPITGAYLEALHTEQGKKNLDSNEQIQKNIKEAKLNLTEKQSCFFVYLLSNGNIEMAQFKNWRAKLELNESSPEEMTLTNVKGYDSVPKIFMTTAMGSTWSNESFVCAKRKIDFTKPFAVYLIQQLGDSKPIKLSWTAPQK